MIKTMITKWDFLDHIQDNTTTFRFWTDNEGADLNHVEHIISKYVVKYGYEIDGIIRIKLDDEAFYEVITTLPFFIFKQNNDFFNLLDLNTKNTDYNDT